MIIRHSAKIEILYGKMEIHVFEETMIKIFNNFLDFCSTLYCTAFLS